MNDVAVSKTIKPKTEMSKGKPQTSDQP